MKKISKYYVHILLCVYLLKVYGSLMLNKYGFISDSLWCDIDCIGNAFLLCSFVYLLKDKMNKFIYSLAMAVFVSRLITELFSGGYEYWYEMISVITLTIVFYFGSKYIKRK